MPSRPSSPSSQPDASVMLKWSFFFSPYSDTQPLPASFSLCKGQWENLFTSYPCLQHSLPLPHTAPHPRLIFSKTGCHTYGPHFRSEVSDTVKYHRSGKPPCSSHPWPSRGWCRPGEAGRAAPAQRAREAGKQGIVETQEVLPTAGPCFFFPTVRS